MNANEYANMMKFSSFSTFECHRQNGTAHILRHQGSWRGSSDMLLLEYGGGGEGEGAMMA